MWLFAFPQLNSATKPKLFGMMSLKIDYVAKVLGIKNVKGYQNYIIDYKSYWDCAESVDCAYYASVLPGKVIH